MTLTARGNTHQLKQLIDTVIIFLFFFILPVDMLNGVMLKSGINLPVSVSQVYKSLLIIILLGRLVLFGVVEVFLLLVLFIALFIPSILQYFFDPPQEAFLFGDMVKTTKYLTTFLGLVYFVNVFREMDSRVFRMIIYWMYFSYALFAFNILLKYAGLGFPMYEYENTGTKGFFYSGNEISALLLILYSFIAYRLWVIKRRTVVYFLFFLFNIFIGITITSKTAMIGVVLVTLLIPFQFRELLYFSFRKIIGIGAAVFLGIPVAIYLAVNMLQGSQIMERFEYFYGKLDLTTFIFSERNWKAEEMFELYKNEYSLLQKLIGGGQYYYENMAGNVIEIDILDLFFAYGIIGLLLFIGILIVLFWFILKNTFNTGYPYARLSLLMFFVLLFVSSIAGHVFNSGIAGFYIGFILAVYMIKEKSI